MGNELEDFMLESTTIWSFPERGKWATHNPKFRGNFAPQIARNIILKYSKPEDVVLDPMMGGGTSLIECKLLNRKGLGIDINPEMINITKKALDFKCKNDNHPIVKLGDVRELKSIVDSCIDLILTQPPYLDIIKYSENLEGDLSRISDVKKFCNELEKGIQEFHRVLKDDCYCAILIGDTRKGRHYVPLSYYVMNKFLKNNFILKEDIIKVQHHCNSTSYWKFQKRDFYLIMHEHLFIFRKPKEGENVQKIKYSTDFLY